MSDVTNRTSITVTDAARKKFFEVTAAEKREGHGLRLIVRGGGSPQPEFGLNFVAPDEDTSNDEMVESEGMKVYFAKETAKFLEGATLDFVETISESGFKVDAPHAGLPRPTGPVAEAVMKVLAEKINPAIAGHGGQISLVAIEDSTAYLRFSGGCQGCGMANVTLKQGVEKALLEDVPEIKRVLDVTDHASGSNPYY
jgi:Fe/S biogenesis protein NfuA